MTSPTSTSSSSWTARLRGRTLDSMESERLLPDKQPEYVASWIYVFGVLTLAALALVLISGLLITLGGPTWWHANAVGHYANSLHLWSVELFFFFMVVHLWGKFFMAAWRGNRALTWITGVVSFLASIATAFTGYLVQTNFDSQWIGGEAKDGINSTGAGAFWNVLNTGQMLLWHVMLLPLAVGVIVILHVLLVRIRGVVPPIGIENDGTPSAGASQAGVR